MNEDNLGSRSAAIDTRTMLRRMVYTKSSEWAYEREWRILIKGRDRQALHEDLRFHKMELDAVILGCRMSDADRLVVSELTRQLYPHAEVLRARAAPKRFQLEIFPAVQLGPS